MPFVAQIPSINVGCKYTVNPPLIVSGNNVAKTVYDKDANREIGSVLLVNTGTAAIKVCFNGVASATNFHTILAADTAAQAGNGGNIQLDEKVDIRSISVFGAAAYELSVVQFVKI